ncbi:E3 ubiquitin-protein ligase TM129-like [Corticium candelabrum]|uniref:E3 ubiquitin-protein ligase TM129-like n=1 Tax=Corticium candelabrum TaxID=121492 RepID=UPI002E26C7EA|nr:E3 ubiquitin-protein ligase TM129-like [Corticium candelabrum]
MNEFQVEFVFAIAYWLFAVCFIAPPDAFRNGGLTVQNLFDKFLGSEQMDFVGYHLRRTTITVVCHSALPLGYHLVGGVVSENLNLFNLCYSGLIVQAYFAVAVCALFLGCCVASFWSWNNWMYHPLAKVLGSFNGPWRATASSVNIEFRRIDKFCSRTSTGGSRIYVTDSWVIKTSAYRVDLAHQQNVHLRILQAEEHPMSIETQTAVQFLWIEVQSINVAVKPFTLRVNSTEYGDIKDKLQSPIRNARSVVIHQTLSDQFLKAFKEQVTINQPYFLPSDAPEPERCVGCMAQVSNIKLMKMCRDPTDGDCQQCFCRPMWCLDCMGKWFASRQEQSQPETWMGSSAPCPTCRAKFCLLDVCVIPNVHDTANGTNQS